MNIKFAGSFILAAALLMPAFSYAADTSTDTTGEYLDDATITTKVKASFAKDKWVKGRDISVRTDQGVVDLTGTVANKKESEHATALATKVKSVKAVHNNLKVKPDSLNQGEVAMKGYVQDIESIAVKNVDFRQVLYTTRNCQLVVMALKPKEEIGAEVHKLDQFFRVEEGTGEAVLDGVRTAIRAGYAVVVPAGVNHNIINTSSVPLKLYTLYAPPNHRDGVVHHTRADAEADNEHFDGKTTE
jgi:mannose-6-phosphate isomerase-like protein (cupin superfamily)